MTHDPLTAWLAAPVRPLTLEQTLLVRRSWQAAYSDRVRAPYKHTRCLCKRPDAKRNEFRGNTFDWHAFSYGRAPVCVDLSAELTGICSDDSTIVVFRESCTLPGFETPFTSLREAARARGALRGDVYFAPYDLSWTLVFTHELSMGLGPYLVRPDTPLRRSRTR